MVNAGRVFLAIMFIFSAISKLISLPFFDAIVAELFLGSNYYDHPQGLFYTQIFTRIVISGELVLGIAMLQHRWFKSLALPGVVAMLLLFTGHLIYEGLTSDKGFIEGNCGCFGDVLPMNNLESIIKNVVALVVGLFVWMKYKTEHTIASWVAPLLTGVVVLLTLFLTVKKYEETPSSSNNGQPMETVIDTVAEPVMEIIDSIPNNDEIAPDKDDEVVETTTAPIDQPEKLAPDQITLKNLKALGTFSNGKQLEVGKGEHLICLFSMTCGHCQESYKEMCEMSQYATLPAIHLINFGKEFEQNYFFNQAGNCSHPYFRTEDYTQFNRLLEGKGFPRIIAVKDGRIVNEWNIDTYNKEVFMKFYDIKEKEEDNNGLNLKKSDDSFDDEFSDDPWK